MAASPIATPIITSDWISPSTLSHLWGYTRQWICRWCRSGFLIQRGFIVYQDHRRRWWIKPPIDHQPPRHRYINLN